MKDKSDLELIDIIETEFHRIADGHFAKVQSEYVLFSTALSELRSRYPDITDKILEDVSSPALVEFRKQILENKK